MMKTLMAALIASLGMTAFAAVDVNRADQATLESVKGVGTMLSERILEARKAGPFKDWADFARRVRGIGERNAARLSAAGLTVGDAAFAPGKPGGK